MSDTTKEEVASATSSAIITCSSIRGIGVRGEIVEIPTEDLKKYIAIGAAREIVKPKKKRRTKKEIEANERIFEEPGHDDNV